MRTEIKILSLLAVLWLYSCVSLQSQNEALSLNDVSKRTLKKYEEVKDLYRQRDYSRTLEALNELIEQEPGFLDAHLLKAAYYTDDFVADRRKVKESLEKVIRLDSLYDKKALFSLARMHYEDGMYNASLQCLSSLKAQERFFQRYEKEIDELSARAAFSRDRLSEADSSLWDIQAFHRPFNTLGQEAFPTMNASWTELFFGRIASNNEDIYQSKKVDAGWSTAVPVSTLNTPFNESTQTLSSDGKTLLFASCGKKDGYGSCDIYGARRSRGKWSEPQNLGPMINTSHWESQPCLAEDGLVLVFSSDRPGGYGGKDLYFSRWTDSGWTRPKNMGPVVNTPGDEGAPFLHFSGQALYFMSTGHLGMGKQDLYVAKGDLESWDTVLHLPPPINSHMEQTSMIVNMSGTEAIYASEINEKAPGYPYMNLDLLRCTLPPLYQAPPASYVSGLVTFQGEPLEKTYVEIYTLDGSYKKKLMTTSDGEFLLSVPFGHRYGIVAEKEGFLLYSNTFNLLDEQWQDSTKYLTIAMQSMEEESKKEPVVLNNIFFDSGESKLKSSSFEELDRLYQFLKEQDQVRIEIQGHTDNIGSVSDNLQLSQERAEAVKNYLVDKGVSRDRIKARGYGEKMPLAENDTEAGRQQNRRTSFLVLSD